MKKEMAPHSSILAWRILWTEEPGGLLSIGSHRLSSSSSNSTVWSGNTASICAVSVSTSMQKTLASLSWLSELPWMDHPTHLTSVQSFSCVWFFATPWTAACKAPLSITSSWSLLKFTCIESVMPSNQPSHPLLSPSPPAFSLSQHQGLFQWVRHLT